MGLILPAWLGDPSFINIVTLKLDSCSKCEELPPLGQLPCLEILAIARMKGIKRVGVEFYGCSNPFPALEYLEFKDLKCWEKWEHIAVDSNRAFPCLQSIQIVDCNSLKGDLPPFPPSLKTLEIQRCRELSVSVSLPNLPLLEELMVFECKSVSITTEDVKQGVSEEGNTPTELVHRHLTNLSIKNCPGVISFPEHLLLPALKELQIHYCENMENLPSVMHNSERLDIKIYRQVIYFLQESLHHLQPLLELVNVPTEEDLNLSLPSASLSTVEIRGVRHLKNLSVVDGTNLKNFEIVFCQKLESLVVGNFNSLSRLKLECCPKLQSLPPLSPTFISTLYLYDLGSCTDAIEQIPGPNLDLPSSLRELSIGGFKNLKTITCSTLPNLWRLDIKHCPKFESFGDTALPSHLTEVYIEECELIKPHLQRQQRGPHNGVIRLEV